MQEIAKVICQNPMWVDLKGKESVPETVHHVQYQVDPTEDRSWLQKEPKIETDGVHSVDKEASNLGAHSKGKECMSEAVKVSSNPHAAASSLPRPPSRPPSK